MPPPTSHGPLPPHALFEGRYRDNAEKHEWLRAIFDDTASDYDRVERWLALGSGPWYRRKALLRAGLAPGMSVADVACGTGLVTREAASIVGPSGSVFGVDPSEGMLGRVPASPTVTTVVGRAEAIPLPDRRVDFLVMGYALRHVEDIRAAFSEFARVLKPGGRLCVLEITRPRTRAGRAMLRGYMGVTAWAACRFGRTASRTPELWTYYRQTIDRCVPPERVLAALTDAGFAHARREVQLGVFSEFTAGRPAA